MAKYKGVFGLKGKLGGLSFYELNGVGVVRQPGGFDGKRIKTDPKMARVRENGSEFGHCSKVNKVFRQGLKPFYAGYTLTQFHSRLQGAFTTIKNLDAVHARGSRTVAAGLEHTDGKQLLQTFSYTPACAFSTWAGFEPLFNWDNQTLTVSGFNASGLPFISGSTHMQLRLGILDFDFESLQYQLNMSAVLTVDRAFGADTFDLAPETVRPIVSRGIAVLGVRYFQDVNGAFVALQGQQAVGFQVVAVSD